MAFSVAYQVDGRRSHERPESLNVTVQTAAVVRRLWSVVANVTTAAELYIDHDRWLHLLQSLDQGPGAGELELVRFSAPRSEELARKVEGSSIATTVRLLRSTYAQLSPALVVVPMMLRRTSQALEPGLTSRS